jgi:hypothetical protein
MKQFYKGYVMKTKRLFLLVICAGLSGACSKGPSSSSNKQKTIDPLVPEMHGIYQALLSPVNKKVSGHLNGALTIAREQDDFVANIRFSGGPTSSIHPQNIHVGTRCPNDSDDLNGDGHIDAIEGAKVYQEIIIPLDDDLSSQWMGLGTFPMSDEYGYYLWSRSTSFEKMINDLKEKDINTTDELVKLNHNKALNLVGNVVVITGVPETTELPETVKGKGRMLKHQALPVACGIIKKLLHSPGRIDNDSTGIPVPEGETIGGSSGADDGAIFDSPEINSENYGEEYELEATDNSTEFDF